MSSTKLKQAISFIENSMESLPQNSDIRNTISILLKCVNNGCGYAYVDWPESQEFMDEDWFPYEAVLDVNESASYFIPINRIF